MKLQLNDYQQNLMNNHVTNIWFSKMGAKTTIAVVRINNGFEIVGSSSCVNPDDFVLELGQHYALVDALNNLDAFIGFYRHEQLYQENKGNINYTKNIVYKPQIEQTARGVVSLEEEV